ncbi:MAG TPA: hypothetical protein PLR41_13255, partial [Alphaproteobacteria bacterium]|nr:hypothetical protein [Alphaproteobacteria bacterium]
MPCLTNHPDLAGLALGALSTLRVVTCRVERGLPELVGAALRFAQDAGAIVDNFHAGGLCATPIRAGAAAMACRGNDGRAGRRINGIYASRAGATGPDGLCRNAASNPPCGRLPRLKSYPRRHREMGRGKPAPRITGPVAHKTW